MASKCDSLFAEVAGGVDVHANPVQVLIVHGRKHICWMLRRILEDKGFGVTVAACAGAALKAVRDKDCEIVFVSSRLPDSGGRELVQKIREIRPEAICSLISDDLQHEETVMEEKQDGKLPRTMTG